MHDYLVLAEDLGQPVRQDKEPAESLVVADNRQGQTGDAVTSESDHLL